MDTNAAAWIVIGLTSAGAVIWLSGLAFLWRATRAIRERDQSAAMRFEVEESSSPGLLAGAAEVDGRPEDLSAKLAALLAREGQAPFGPVRVLSCDSRRLDFETTGSMGSGGGIDGKVRRGQFLFAPLGSRTRIEYAIEVPSGRVLLGIGWLFVALGLAALVVGCWLMFAFVVASPNPSARSQAFQMVQAVHLLWPPFLFATLARQPARMIEARVSALVHNLPYS